MIKIDGNDTVIRGDSGTIIAEISTVWYGVIEAVAKEMEVDPQEIRNEIIESGVYLTKRMSGISHEEAMKHD